MRKRLSVQLMAGITLTLVALLSANLVMVWRQEQSDLISEMHEKARVLTQSLVSMRLYIARSQDRINKDATGHFEFKGLNPAAVGRGVGDIFRDVSGGYQMKQTRFQVRRPENAPDAFEWEALTKFSQDPTLREIAQPVKQNGTQVYRYVVPLTMEKECLQCHGGPVGQVDVAGYPKEGYKEGELGGAISVVLPMADAESRLRHNAMRQVWVIIGVTLVSLLVIYLLSRRLVSGPLEHLAGVAAGIGEGKLAITASDLRLLHGSTELGVVADSVQEMARNLRELYEGLEQKVAERTRELNEANELQSQFLATVSHELRTPLTSIIAFTELLLKQADGQQREYLEDVLESSRRLLEVVNNLLDLSRLKAGRIELFTDLVELPELAQSALRPLRPLADKKQITLEIRPMRELPLVLVDPLRVRQVLINLVGNAIKFTPQGGHVTVSARTRARWVELSVTDDGPGIAEENRELIFEAFRRVEERGQAEAGSGLGLAICRDLVELHGGRIWVENVAGGGARFNFTLPVAPLMTHEEEDPHADA